MGNRQHDFATDEYYHCYNRGTEKRKIFCDHQDYVYFLKCLRAYNTSEVFGKLRRYKNKEQLDPPVTILAYCLLPNHYHLVLRNNNEYGISKYIQRVSGGYTMYFNKKHKRNGGLFQGTFKSKYIPSDQDLNQLLAYVYYNYKIHNITDKTLYRNSLNTKDELVRGLTSTYGKKHLNRIVEIIKNQRLTMD